MQLHKILLGPEEAVENPFLKGEGNVSISPEGPSKCWCIRKSSLIAIIAYKKHTVMKENLKPLKKLCQYFFIFCGKNSRKRHVHLIPLENATSRAKTNIILTSCFLARYWCDVTFCDSPGLLTVKSTKQVYNSTWIALLKQRFLCNNI